MEHDHSVEAIQQRLSAGPQHNSARLDLRRHRRIGNHLCRGHRCGRRSPVAGNNLRHARDADRAARILEKAEQHCLISNSIKTAIRLEPEMDVAQLGSVN